MTQTRREQQREDTTSEIKVVARQQMAEGGATALSLRAIARQMGLTAPALYRYYENRDALVTALIVEAYTALADAMAAADEAVERDDFHGRFQAIAFAFREWAIRHPQDYTLIYGTPIPGYEAPRDQTVEPAARVMIIIGRTLGEALAAGKLKMPAVYDALPPGLQTAVNDILPYLPENSSPAGVVLTMTLWARLHGVVWGELYEHFIPGLAESGALYQFEVAAILAELFGEEP